MTDVNFSRDELRSFQTKLIEEKTLATYIILAFILVLYGLEEYFGSSKNISNLLKMGANSKDLVLNSSEYYRLFSSIYLHSGFMHLFFNSYVLYALGGMFNKVLGTRNFLLIFFVSGFFGSLASVFLGKAPASVGASGAIWGFLGASLALAIFPSDYFPAIIRKRLLRVSLINLLINLGVSMLPMVDFWAHAGGGIGGFFLTWIIIKGNSYQSLVKNIFLNSIVALMIALNLSCSVYAIYANKPWQNSFNQPLKHFSKANFPLEFSLPQNLKEVTTKEKSLGTQILFGNFVEDELVIEISVQNISKWEREGLLQKQIQGLMAEKSIPANIKKTAYLRTETYGEILSFEKELNNGIFAFVNLLALDHYLVTLTAVAAQENAEKLKPLINAIFSNMKPH